MLNGHLYVAAIMVVVLKMATLGRAMDVSVYTPMGDQRGEIKEFVVEFRNDSDEDQVIEVPVELIYEYTDGKGGFFRGFDRELLDKQQDNVHRPIIRKTVARVPQAAVRHRPADVDRVVLRPGQSHFKKFDTERIRIKGIDQLQIIVIRNGKEVGTSPAIHVGPTRVAAER